MIDWDRHVLAPLSEIFGEAEPVMFAPLSGRPQILRDDAAPVFDDRFLDEALDDRGFPVTTTRPVLGARAAAFRQLPVQGDRFTIRRRLWVVTDVHPDSQGHLQISLRLASDPAA